MAKVTLAQLAADLAHGRTSARALVEASLAAIADPSGEGARTFIRIDAEGARSAADYMDGLRKASRAPSPYAGIPIAVKDLFDLVGEVTTAGSKVLASAAPAMADAPAIARLKAQGFIVLGRTNMTEFAYSGVGLNPHYGTPRSVFERHIGRIPGGSSSGSAVAVADGMTALAIGSDTGGSCRIPAAYNGIVGYKSSHGRVPLTGVYPLSKSLDTIGPIANSAACCALADAVMAGGPPVVPKSRPAAGLRLGILRDYVLENLESAVAEDFARALKRLGSAGATLVDVAFPELLELPGIYAKGGILGAEAFSVHRAGLAANAAAFDPRVSRRLEIGGTIPAADYLDYQRRRADLVALFRARCAGLDGLVLPTVMMVPPPIAALKEDADYFRLNGMSLRNTAVGNFLDSCAISLPMQAAGAAPTGFTVMAPWGSDESLLGVAQGVEEVLEQKAA